MSSRKEILNPLALNIIFLAIINFLAIDFGWYYIYSWFDILMHFWGGFTVFYLVNYIFYNKLSVLNKRNFIILLGVFIIGFSWEVYEYIVVNVWAGNNFNLNDTLFDLFFDVLGGIFSMLIINKNGK